MDKTLSAHTTFVKAVDQLRNTECSDKHKIHLFQEISETITSPALGSYVNFSRHCGSAVSVLLLFTEDLDHNVRIKAEENLYRIIRHLEKHRLNRLLMDLYGEIKKNGNQRSLKICLQVFSNFLPKIKEKNIKWYSVKLIPSLQVISQRTETMVIESFNNFFSKFSKYIHIISPNEHGINFLLETFLQNMVSNIPAQRRSSSENAMTLISCSRHKLSFAKKSLSISIEILLTEPKSTDVILGVFGFFKTLLPFLLSEPNFKDFRTVIEIFDLALYFLETSHLTSSHAVINASLEVVNSILKCMENKILMNILCNDANCKQRQEYLNKRKSLKNQIIFHHYNMEEKSFQTEETRTESEDKHNQSDDKSLILSDLELENESLSSIDFDAIKLTSDQFVDETGENQLNEEQHPDNEQEIQSSGMIFDKMMVSGEKERSSKFYVSTEDHIGKSPAKSIKQQRFQTPQKNHNLPIGSIFSQSLLHYTVRLMAGRFLLNGTKSSLKSDEISRISIKNLSLETISLCVRLDPQVLQLSLQVNDGNETSCFLSVEDDAADQEEEENIVVEKDYSPPKPNKDEELVKADELKEKDEKEKLLDIKFDHFCDEDENPSGYFYDFNLESEIDQDQIHKTTKDDDGKNTEKNRFQGITFAEVELNAAMSTASVAEKMNDQKSYKIPSDVPMAETDFQSISDVLLYWSHSDPMLRGHVQIIAGYYFIGCAEEQRNSGDYILGICIKGLKDENHHVVIQSLTAFSMIFPIMLSKYLDSRKSSGSSLQKPTMNVPHQPDTNQIYEVDAFKVDENEEEFDDSLLNTTMANNLSNTLNRNRHKSSSLDCGESREERENAGPGIGPDPELGPETNTESVVSPKYLLNKALRCRNNKYWLVQNKYAETISNLDYILLSSVFGEEFRHWLMNNLLNELITLISADDFRIRENAAKCITNFINNFLHLGRGSVTAGALGRSGIGKSCSGNGRRGNDDGATGNILVADDDNVVEAGYGFENKNMEQKLVQLFFYENVVVDGFSKYLRELFSVKITGKQRSVHEISSILAKVFYILTNKLLDFHKKNEHLGMIYTLNIMIVEFHPILYHNVYEEFKLVEIFLNICRNNYEMANDINVQILCLKNLSLLVGANILSLEMSTGNGRRGTFDDENEKTIELNALFVHSMKLLNIYCHVLSNQKPLCFIRPQVHQKNDIFTIISAKELAIANKIGYFGNEYVYINLYNTIQTTYDVYKITINEQSGINFIELLATSINALSLCLEFKEHSLNPAGSSDALDTVQKDVMKLVEEILQYLNILIDYAPIESIECLRQLQKYMFKRNLASNLHGEYQKFTEMYKKGIINGFYNELFVNAGKYFGNEYSPIDEKFAKNIKLFEPMVVYCLTIFMKANAAVQSSILNLLSDLLDLKVTLSVLDSKSLIFEQILKHLELIEKCGIREEPGEQIIPAIIRFLFKLTYQTDKSLMTIPKLLNIANNLLVNNSIKNANILGIKTLSFKMFMDGKSSNKAYGTTVGSELNAQKEVLIGMLEKFIDSTVCQEMLTLLLLWFNFEYKDAIGSSRKVSDTSVQQNTEQPMEVTTLENGTIILIFLTALKCRKLEIQSDREINLIELVFQNTSREVFLRSDVFSMVLATFLEMDMDDYHNISYATIILKNILLETNEIYLVNHIKVYRESKAATASSAQPEAAAKISERTSSEERLSLSSTSLSSSSSSKGHANDDDVVVAGASSFNEIKYFTQVLYEKLDRCLQFSVANSFNRIYCGIVVRFIRALCNMKSNGADAFATVFGELSSTLCEHHFMIKYYQNTAHKTATNATDVLDLNANAQTQTFKEIKIEIFKFHLQHNVNKSELINNFVQLLETECLKDEIADKVFGMVLEKYSNEKWTEDEAELIFSRNLLNILINSNYSFVVDLCNKWKFAHVFIQAVLRNLDILDVKCIRPLLKLLQDTKELSTELKIEFLSKIYEQFGDRISYRKMIHSTILKIIPANKTEKHGGNGKAESAVSGAAATDDDDDDDDGNSTILFKLPAEIREELLGNKINNEEIFESKFKLNIIDEKWLMNQIINFSSILDGSDPTYDDYTQDEFVNILLDIKSETKLLKLFQQIPEVNLLKLLKSAIHKSLESTITSFQNECIQHKAHINYMSLNPLGKVSLSTLITKINETVASTKAAEGAGTAGAEPVAKSDMKAVYYLARAVSALFHTIENLETMCLIYVDLKHVEKFMTENIFKPKYVESFIDFVGVCCREMSAAAVMVVDHQMYLECIDCILQAKWIWLKFNEMENYEIVNFVFDEFQKLRLFNTSSCQKWIQKIPDMFCDSDAKVLDCKEEASKTKEAGRDKQILRAQAYIKAIFIAKLIEAQIDTASEFESVYQNGSYVLFNTLKSIGTSLLCTNELYSIAITPLEVLPRNQQYGVNLSESSRMTTISVEQLSDLNVLHNFIRRLSVFGFSSRQQFEEHFMTFLLLINKDFDENNFDVQEEYIIKSTCLQIIIQLLLMYKTFPIVGNKLSRFKHSTRCQHLKFDSVSLKKLHQAQLLLCESSNVFNHPNLERDLSSRQNDNFIGTHNFWPNQYDLYYIWHQMEQSSQFQQSVDEGSEDFRVSDGFRSRNKNNGIIETNFQYYCERSGIDFKSSAQVVFDVLSELLQTNPSLSLPVLVNFVEICECREHIEWIKDTIQRIQITIPVDDTISHQHIIYLMCKTQAILIPTLSEVKQLCAQITFYLKSSHIFVRNATLCGLLSLLECCTKTNTTIGKLSEELTALREVSTAYINFHISNSSIKCSSVHTRLVWTLNFCLIEWTSKFVPDCKLISTTIPIAKDILRTTNDEHLYLIVLHGYERLIIQNLIDAGHFEKLSMELVKVENTKFGIPAMKLLLSCLYMKSSSQLERTELSDGVIQDDPEIIVQITDKVDALLHCIRTSTKDVAELYGRVLCQIIRDLVPPNEILTKVIKEFLSENQPYSDIMAKLIYTIFRLAIDSMYLEMLQEWLLCTIPTILAIPKDTNKCVWCLCVLFLSSSINSHLIKLLPILLDVDSNSKTTSANSTTTTRIPKDNEISLFVTLAHDFYGKLNTEQKHQFRRSFEQSNVLRTNRTLNIMLNSLL